MSINDNIKVLRDLVECKYHERERETVMMRQQEAVMLMRIKKSMIIPRDVGYYQSPCTAYRCHISVIR